MDLIYKPYLGSGKVFARVAGTLLALLPIGNVSMFEPTVKEDKKTLKDYTKPGGGTYASVSRIDTVTVKLKMHDLNRANVARSLFGTDSVVTGAAVIDEVVKAYKGGLSALQHVNPTAVVVTDTTAATTFVEGVDYEVSGGGLLILANGAIPDAASLKVDYSFADYVKIEGMTTGAVILELHLEGLNEADSGKPVILDAYRAQLSPAKAMSLLGDNFSDLEVEAELLKDPSKTGMGISQYFSMKFA